MLSSPPVHVLLIEDNPGDARLVKEELRAVTSKITFQLEWVDCLEKGLKVLSANHIHAILLDLSLPDSEGLQTLESVLLHAPHLPVVVMTGQIDDEVGMRAVQAGAQDYLIKGQVDGRLLTRALQYAIQRKQTELQLADALEFNECMVTSAPVGIFTYRLSGECLSANAAAARMVGGTIERLKSQNFHEIESWKPSGLYQMAVETIATGKATTGDVHVLTSFGKDAWYTAHFVLFRSGGDELLLMMFSDITERIQAEMALKASERFTHETLDALTANIAILDEAGMIVAVNRSWREFARANGADPDAVCEGINYLAVCDAAAGGDSEQASDVAAGIRAVIHGEQKSYSLEYPCHSPGEKRWFIARVTRFEGEGLPRVVIAHEYITERKLAEEALRESEENYRQLFESESDAILLIENETGRILQANNAACLLYGYSQEELLTKRNTDLSAEPEQTQHVTKETPVAPDQVVTIPLRFHRKRNGMVFPVEITGRFFVHQGRPVHIAAIRDITERRQAEAALEASERRFRTWIENSSDLVTVVDMNGVIQYQSPSARPLLGYTQEEILGKRGLDLLHPDDRERMLAILIEIQQESDVSAAVECRIRHRDGSWRFVESVGHTFIDEHGEVMALINSRDITDRKEAEAAVAAMQRRFQALIENAPDGIALLGLDGKLRQVTPSTQQILGYTLAEAEGQDPALLTHPDDLPQLLGLLHELAQDPDRVIRTEYRFRHKDGSWRWLESTISNMAFESSVQAIVFNYRDITDRKTSEAALRDAEAKYRTLVEQVPAVTYTAAADELSSTVYVSPQVKKILGFLPEEMTSSADFWARQIHPEDQRRVLAELENSRLSGTSFNSEYRMITKDGREVWISDTADFAHDAFDRPHLLQGVMLDITERRQLEAQLQQSEATLRGFYESAPSLMGITELVGDDILHVYDNPATCRFFGVEKNATSGRLGSELGAPPGVLQEWIRHYRESERSGAPVYFEYLHEDGSQPRWLAVTVALIATSNGTLPQSRFCYVAEEITERKQTEVALRDSEARYRAVMENSVEAIYLYELHTKHVVVANPAFMKLLGYQPEEICNLTLYDVVANERSSIDLFLKQVLSEGATFMGERLWRRKDGTTVPMEVTANKIQQSERDLIFVVGRDITTRKQAEAALKASEQRYRELAENFPNGVVSVYNKDLTMVFTAGLELIASGYTADDFVGKHFAELASQQTWEWARLHLLAAFAGQVASYEAQGLDGQYYRVNVAPLHDANGEINEILVVSQNITDLKKTELALREKEHLLSEAQRIGHTGSWSYDISSDKMKFSDEMYRLFDVLPEEFDHNSKDFLALVYPSDRPAAAQWLGDIKAGLQTRKLDFRVFRKNGELRYLQCGGAVDFDDTGKPSRFIGTTQDVTERKVAELQIDQHIRRLTALAEVDRAIVSSFDQRYTLGVIVSQVMSQLQVDATCVLTLDSEEQMLTYTAGRGFRTKTAETAHFPLSIDYAGRVVREKRMIRIPDLREATNNSVFQAFVTEEGFVSYMGVPLIVKGKVKGVLEVYQRTLLQPYQEWLDFFNTLAGQAAIAVENASLFGNLQATNQELVHAYDATIEGWSRAMDLRDRETEGHTQRVTSLALELARAMGIEEDRLIHIRRGALLHDIGKLGIPDQILFKPNRLTPEEWQIMQKHTEFAYEMLSSIEYLKPALHIPYSHHEKWDGTGYPLGLKGEGIPLEARIFTIVDVWDALRSDRPYRKAWSTEKTLDYICDQSGKHFDPQVVECFLKIARD